MINNNMKFNNFLSNVSKIVISDSVKPNDEVVVALVAEIKKHHSIK